MRKFSYLQFICLAGFQMLLFFAFIARVDNQEKYYSRNHGILKMMFPDDEPSKDPAIKSLSGPDILKEWKKTNKKFITINLTGDFQEDEKRIDFIRMEARRLKYTCDTTHILRVHFTEENTYGQFVQLVSIMQKDLHKRYLFTKMIFTYQEKLHHMLNNIYQHKCATQQMPHAYYTAKYIKLFVHYH